jgi:hypothetical protein
VFRQLAEISSVAEVDFTVERLMNSILQVLKKPTESSSLPSAGSSKLQDCAAKLELLSLYISLWVDMNDADADDDDEHALQLLCAPRLVRTLSRENIVKAVKTLESMFPKTITSDPVLMRTLFVIGKRSPPPYPVP